MLVLYKQRTYPVAWLEGKFIDESFLEPPLIGGEEADVFKPEGTLLVAYRPKVLTPELCRQAYPALYYAAKLTYNRGTAAGGSFDRIKEDGTIARTRQTKPVLSGIAGFFDPTPRYPSCRTTEYTAQQVGLWRTVLPLIREVNQVFQDVCPDRYQAQLEVVQRTRPEWIIGGTAFSTITVNRNFRTAVHKDEGDLPQGFGVMTVLEEGYYSGGYLVYPKYGVGVDVRHGDVLFGDVHQYHANTPILGVPGCYNRVSVVFYYRSEMVHCGTAQEELERAKNGPLSGGT